MDPDSLIPIGFVLRAHGLKGELKLRFHKPIDELPEVIFIDRVPYFIKSVKPTTGQEAIGLFEDLDTKEAADKLSGKEISVEADAEVVLDDTPVDEYEKLVGYTALDASGVELGPVKEVVEMPMQMLLQIDYKNNSIMIPLNNDSLQKIDHKARKVYLLIPDGLIDIYS